MNEAADPQKGHRIIQTKLLRFWTLSVVLLLFKTHNVSESGFCLRLQVEPTQLDPVDRDSRYLRTPASVSQSHIATDG
jgi:hypothetical protein